MFVGHELKKLQKEHPEIELDAIDVTFHYKRAMDEGIRMFPALKIEGEILAGFILSRQAIRTFVESHL